MNGGKVSTDLALLRRGAELVDASMLLRLERRVAADHPDLPEGMSERVVDQALAFLGTCATATRPLGPSDLVDLGWHAFILYTEEYAAFCDRIAGRFIHHVPDDATTLGDSNSVPIMEAVTAIRAAGFVVDAELWVGAGVSAECNTGKCHQCHAGCYDSPRS
jgi:hypothetical protein